MNLTTTSLFHLGIVAGIFDELETYYWVEAEIAVNQQVITHLASFVPLYDKLHDIIVDARRSILLRKCNLELNMTATEVTESTERGLGGGKDISVYSGRKLQKTDMV
jgi:hypothetical protein